MTAAFLVVMSVGSVGCHWVLPLGASDDAKSDGSASDGNLDRLTAPDAPQDSLPFDDATLDKLPLDVGTDQPVDVVPLSDLFDAKAPDTAGDTSSPPPCANSTQNTVGAWTNMTLCEGPTGIPQDQAAALCAPGWHLCTAADYLARGGKKKVTNVQSPSYWLAACVVPGTPPLDTTCVGWTTGCASTCTVGWGCTGPPGVSRTGSDRYPLKGPHPYCYRMGQDDAKYGAYWFALTPTSTTPTGAICCLDP
jgi:hypothetical protein